jgi:hypothetical protein
VTRDNGKSRVHVQPTCRYKARRLFVYKDSYKLRTRLAWNMHFAPGLRMLDEFDTVGCLDAPDKPCLSRKDSRAILQPPRTQKQLCGVEAFLSTRCVCKSAEVLEQRMLVSLVRRHLRFVHGEHVVQGTVNCGWAQGLARVCVSSGHAINESFAHLKNVGSRGTPTHEMTYVPTSCQQIALQLRDLPRQDRAHRSRRPTAIRALDLYHAATSTAEVIGSLAARIAEG